MSMRTRRASSQCTYSVSCTTSVFYGQLGKSDRAEGEVCRENTSTPFHSLQRLIKKPELHPCPTLPTAGTRTIREGLIAVCGNSPRAAAFD